MSETSTGNIPTKFEQLLRKLDDLMWSNTKEQYVSIFDVKSAQQAIKDYTLDFAKRCLEIAAEIALIEEEDLEEDGGKSTHSGGYIRDEHYVCVHKPSITDIELPVQ